MAFLLSEPAKFDWITMTDGCLVICFEVNRHVDPWMVLHCHLSHFKERLLIKNH